VNAPLKNNPLSAAAIQPDIVTLAVPADERVWVPQAPGVWFRPLMLNTVTGGWFNLLRVRKSGILSRHRHPMAVFGYVIKGNGVISNMTGLPSKAGSFTSRRARYTRWWWMKTSTK